MKVKDHSDVLSAQYLVNCLEEDHACHGITTQEPRPMKETPLQTSNFLYILHDLLTFNDSIICLRGHKNHKKINVFINELTF